MEWLSVKLDSRYTLYICCAQGKRAVFDVSIEQSHDTFHIQDSTLTREDLPIIVASHEDVFEYVLFDEGRYPCDEEAVSMTGRANVYYLEDTKGDESSLLWWVFSCEKEETNVVRAQRRPNQVSNPDVECAFCEADLSE